MKIYSLSEMSQTILWTSFLFVLIYAPPVLPYTNLILGMFVLSIMLIKHDRDYLITIKESGLGIWIKVMIGILIYTLIIPLPLSAFYDDIVDASHYYHLFNRFTVLLFMEVTCATYILTYFKKKKLSYLCLIKLVIWAAMIQSALACAAFVIPGVKDIFLAFMTQMGGTSTENEGVIVNRTFGFASSMLDQFGLCTGLIAGLSFFLGVNYKSRYIFYSLFIIIASLLNARSGIFIYFAGIMITMFFSVFINHNVKMIIKSLAMLLLIPTVFAFSIEVVSVYNENTAEWISKGVDSVVEFIDTGSSNQDNMATITSDNFWELPNDLNILIGTGHSRYMAVGYAHTDNGWVNDIWFVGILGILVMYGAVLFMWLRIFQRSDNSLMKFAAVFFPISFCVFDVKAVVIGYQPGGAIFFFILFASYFFCDAKSKAVK